MKQLNNWSLLKPEMVQEIRRQFHGLSSRLSRQQLMGGAIWILKKGMLLLGPLILGG